MFLICSAPPQLSPLSSDPLMLSLFLTGSDLLSNTFQQPTPATHTDLSQQTLRFYFSHFLASFLLQPWWNITASTSVFSSSPLHQGVCDQLSTTSCFICSGLSVALRIICYSIVCLSLCSDCVWVLSFVCSLFCLF